MRFAIYSRLFKGKDEIATQKLFDAIQQLNIDFIVFESYYEQLRPTIKLKEAQTFKNAEELKKHDIDFFVTLGGDGTILDAPLLIQDTGIPVVGFNLGRLGFLSGFDIDNITESLNCLLKGTYIVEERTLLQLESSIPIFKGANIALNDCTILKRDTSSMIIIHTYINGEFLNSYWADGIIVSTPTGSTGYSLSCGGPIVFPNSGNFIITPVAPHNLNIRPLVISDDSVISFEIEGRAENYLCTLDSRFETITATHKIAVKKAAYCCNLVRLHNRNFLTTIRNKLSWGIDTRN